jgi:hypothetical protein
MHTALWRFLPLFSLLATGCLQQAVPAHPPGVDDATLRDMLASGAYRGDGFVLVNRTRYPSALAAGAMIDVYVSVDAADAYRAVDPESMTMGDPFPVGGVIVREVWSGGVLTKLTTMEKEPHGYYPDVGDFLFGATDLEGRPMTNDDHSAQWGARAQCGSCHESKRAGAGYLFGVPADNRN